MKRIFFIRHAKSSWEDYSLSDLDRPLNKRGRRDAPIMAEKLSAIKSKVDIIICSPAKRAQETSTHFINAIDHTKVITIDRLYHASVYDIIDVVQAIDSDHNTAIIFGHNPGFTRLYNMFAKDSLDNLPTCGIFELLIDGPWNDLDSTNTNVGNLLYPKLYKP